MMSSRSTQGLIRRVAVGLGAASLAVLTAVVWSVLVTAPGNNGTAPASATANGWGSEALESLQAHARDLAPIPVANACGIGASSCFKCHNGKRAAAPKMDKEKGLWHAQHKTVNDSCVGCHGGNARIIKKELSHQGMVNDPRTKPEQCVSCHKADDQAALLKRYAKAP
jgi:nitrate/TMAO reductase-like tetraheme cytochrome c subunit